jgi:hypothetical protein
MGFSFKDAARTLSERNDHIEQFAFRIPGAQSSTSNVVVPQVPPVPLHPHGHPDADANVEMGGNLPTNTIFDEFDNFLNTFVIEPLSSMSRTTNLMLLFLPPSITLARRIAVRLKSFKKR